MVRFLALALLVAACDLGTVPITGGPNPNPNPNPTGVDAGTPAATGMQTFTAAVYPILQTKCQGCHTSGPNANFCAASAASAYTAIVGLPSVVGTFDAAAAPVLTKIAGGHNGATYTSTDISTITGWLNQEKAAR